MLNYPPRITKCQDSIHLDQNKREILKAIDGGLNLSDFDVASFSWEFQLFKRYF